MIAMAKAISTILKYFLFIIPKPSITVDNILPDH